MCVCRQTVRGLSVWLEPSIMQRGNHPGVRCEQTMAAYGFVPVPDVLSVGITWKLVSISRYQQCVAHYSPSVPHPYTGLLV